MMAIAVPASELNNCRQTRAAFTLTELLTVLCILGIVASAGIHTFSSLVRHAERATSLPSIEATVAWAVSRSRQEPVELTIDLDQQTLHCRAIDSKQTKRQVLSKQLKLTELLRYGMQRDQGSVTLEFRDGSCDTFALHVSEVSGQENLDQWILVLGSTGEIVNYEHSSETSAAISKWMAQWSNLN